MTSPAAAVILAGGRGRRLGGRDKPALLLDGRTLLDIALDAVAGCPVVVVVGPDRGLPAGVIATREDPPGGGPAAGVAAGIDALPALPAQALVAVLAADLPGIRTGTVARLCVALQTAAVVDVAGDVPPRPGGAVLLDTDGHRQPLIGVWRHGDLVAAIARRDSWAEHSVRELLAPIPVIAVPGSDRETADVDTPDDWSRWQSGIGRSGRQPGGGQS